MEAMPAPSKPVMTKEEREAALREAERFGVDLDHLRWNLKLTPEQRLAGLQSAIRAVHLLRHAKRLTLEAS
jgi:hypothetical protein